MARLHKQQYPGDWKWRPGEDSKTYFSRIDNLIASIPQDRIMTFPVCDGKALYFVMSEKPLVLQHIPFGDAYKIPDAHLRGLRIEDWKKQLQFRSLFRNKTVGGAG